MFFVERYFESSDPKIHGPRNYLQGFYVAALINKYETTDHYTPVMYRNGISKETISSVTDKMEDGIPLSSSDSATASKRRKNRRDRFNFQIKKNLYLSKHRMKSTV